MAFSPQSPYNVLKNRNAVLKLQKRFPVFRDIHREKFKSRLKSNRGEFMNSLRHMTREEVQQTLTIEDKMIWSDLQDDDTIMDTGRPTEEYVGLESELEEWVMQQYEEYMAEEEGMINSLLEAHYPEELISMICKCGKVLCKDNGSAFRCDRCSMPLHTAMTVDNLHVHPHAKIDSQDASSGQQPWQGGSNTRLHNM